MKPRYLALSIVLTHLLLLGACGPKSTPQDKNPQKGPQNQAQGNDAPKGCVIDYRSALDSRQKDILSYFKEGSPCKKNNYGETFARGVKHNGKGFSLTYSLKDIRYAQKNHRLFTEK